MRLLQQKLIKYDAPQKTKEAGIYPYFRAISSEQDTEVIMSGRKVLMFGSNSYLGLTNHPKVKEAAIEATKKYGTGMAGSRFLNGTLDIHVELEHKLAKFVGKEEAIIFAAGMLVNVGVIPALTGKDDYILWDELNRFDSRRSPFEFLQQNEIQAQRYGIARETPAKLQPRQNKTNHSRWRIFDGR